MSSSMATVAISTLQEAAPTADLMSLLVGGPFVFGCPKCSFMTLTVHRLRQHALTDHGGNLSYQLYVCSVCTVTSTEHSIIRDHVELAHMGAVILAQNVRLEKNSINVKQGSLSNGDNLSNGLLVGSLNNSSPSPAVELVREPRERLMMTTLEAQQARSEPPTHNWTKLIARNEKKFLCQICFQIYPGRTEAVFHTVTKHLLHDTIEYDLCHFKRLSDDSRSQIRRLFSEGMRIRSGVHYKNAEMVESALFLSIEVHLRQVSDEVMKCSDCQAQFGDLAAAFLHINDKIRNYLPEFMRSRSCPWSLHTREEWVWVVPDDINALPPPSSPKISTFTLPGSPKNLIATVDLLDEEEEAELQAVLGEATTFRGECEYLDEEVVGVKEEDTVLSAEELSEKEAMLRDIYVIGSNQGYSCSNCPLARFPSETLAKEHIVEQHLEVQLAVCPHCHHQSDQRGMKAHITRNHKSEDHTKFIYNPAFHSLQHLIKLSKE